MIRQFAIVALLLTAPSASFAQAAVQPGDDIRFRHGDKEFAGRVFTIDREWLSVDVGNGNTLRLGADSVRELQVLKGRKSAFGTGAGVGALVGALIGAAVTVGAVNSCPQSSGGFAPSTCAVTGSFAIPVGVIAGFVVGGILGAATGKDNWVDVSQDSWLEPRLTLGTTSGIGVAIRF